MTRPRVPAAWLARIARVLFTAEGLARVVYPALADLQHEVSSAVSWRERTRARLRGYWGFWKLVCLAPFAFNHVATGNRPARGLWPVAALVLVAMVLFVGWRPFMNELFAWLVNGIPENVFESLGRFSRFSYLAGPLAIVALVLAARRRFRIGLPEVTLLSLLSVSLTAVLSTAAVIAAFTSIGRSGSGALIPVTGAMTASVAPLSTAIAAFGICVLGIALIAMVQRGRPSPPSSPVLLRMPVGMALGLSFLVIVSVLSIDQFLRAHRELTEAIVVLTDPVKVTAAGGDAFALASRLEVSGTVMLWGTFLTAMLPLAGITTWRASRVRLPHPVFTWTAHIAVVVALAACAWHARAIHGDLDSFQGALTRMRAMDQH